MVFSTPPNKQTVAGILKRFPPVGGVADLRQLMALFRELWRFVKISGCSVWRKMALGEGSLKAGQSGKTAKKQPENFSGCLGVGNSA